MPTMMKAAIYHAIDDIRLEERPVPEIGPGDILLKSLACGLCGGEAMPWYKKGQPKVLGHEPVGEIVEIGRNVTEFKIGERLFVNHHVGRVRSHWSLRGHTTRDPYYSTTHLDPGGVCEYYRVTAEHLRMDVHRIPNSMSNEAATTIEPWSCVVGGLKLCGIQPGDTVAVVGAGFMGQGFIHMAPLFGAGKVVALDLSEWRLQMARTRRDAHDQPEDNRCRCGVARDQQRAAGRRRRRHRSNQKAWEQAVALTEVGGTLHLGAPLAAPNTPRARTAIAPISTRSPSHRNLERPKRTYSYFRLLDAGRVQVNKAITHFFDIKDSAIAFKMLVDAGDSLKIIVYPHGLPAHVVSSKKAA